MTTTSWGLLLGLGAFHGINPGMGWLFAVSLGLQERRRAAVLSALLPLGLGHALAVALVIVVVLAADVVVPIHSLRWVIAGVLVGLGIARSLRHRHPRWASMRVNGRALTLWSFLMASAHGAGLMVVPVLMALGKPDVLNSAHHEMQMVATSPASALFATLLHAAGYLMVTAVVALVVFEKLGVGILRKGWLNLDLVWAISLIVTGVVTVI